MIRILLPILVVLLAIACSDDAAAPTIQPSRGTVAATPGSITLPPDLTQALVTHVVDGDTIDVEIDGEEYRVRYIGIDTPETVDPRRPIGCFGPQASDYNKSIVDGRAVGLEKDVSETDRFGRLLRYVWLPAEITPSGQPEMANSMLVRNGYAQASTYPPDVKYQDTFINLQREARESGVGLWSDFCASQTATASPMGTGTGGCEFSGTTEPLIKGNISSSGEKIYHTPGQQYYDGTVITEAKGERWFCTEADAVAAGWRKSKV